MGHYDSVPYNGLLKESEIFGASHLTLFVP